MKINTEKGFLNFWILLILFFIIISSVVTSGVFETRAALAEDIKSLKLHINTKAKRYIEIGDRSLEEVIGSEYKIGNSTYTWFYNNVKHYEYGQKPEDIITKLFYAKVLYDRARLSMETEDQTD